VGDNDEPVHGWNIKGTVFHSVVSTTHWFIPIETKNDENQYKPLGWLCFGLFVGSGLDVFFYYDGGSQARG